VNPEEKIAFPFPTNTFLLTIPRMDAHTLHCPNCGAAASIDSTKCDHCGAGLATVACASCFGMIFLGSKFCPHCGARAGRIEDENETTNLSCPRCQVSLQSVAIGPAGEVKVHECPKCVGLWVNVETFEAICSDREQQALVLGGASSPPARIELKLEEVRYLSCPRCRTLMNRVNFAGRSGVIIDACRGHGTWFDRNELQNIVNFIRSGGLEIARERQQEQLEATKRRVTPVPAGSIGPTMNAPRTLGDGWDATDVIYLVLRELAEFFFTRPGR
jgi:Zn-finger nucleic acid-binding protein